MALSLLAAHHISELCIGKPALTCLPVSATVADAFSALKSSDQPFLSVWDCRRQHSQCRCLAKLSMLDLICFLCRLPDCSSPLSTPVSHLISSCTPSLIAHLEPSSSLNEAIDVILGGAQSLVVPISRKTTSSSTTTVSNTVHNGAEFCWITQEDIIRFLLSSIGLFSPIPFMSIASLGIISGDAALTADYHSPAINSLDLIAKSLADQTAVAVLDGDGVLIGEISPHTLAARDEAAAAAITTLSAGDLMAYIDGGGAPPEDLEAEVRRRLGERSRLGEAVKELAAAWSESSSSSEEEEAAAAVVVVRRWGRTTGSYSARMGRRAAEAIVCQEGSSLVAVMIQAIAHRVSYVWVVDDDSCLVGIVTFFHILRVFRECTIT